MVLKAGGSRPLVHPKYKKSLVSQSKSRSDTSTEVLVDLHCYFSLRTSSSMAEQWTLNPLVLGSNPRGCTIIWRYLVAMATATSAATRALFSAKARFAGTLRPAVASPIRPSTNGVTAAPRIPAASQSSNACANTESS